MAPRMNGLLVEAAEAASSGLAEGLLPQEMKMQKEMTLAQPRRAVIALAQMNGLLVEAVSSGQKELTPALAWQYPADA